MKIKPEIVNRNQRDKKTIVDLKNEECFAFTQSPYKNLNIMRCLSQQKYNNEAMKFHPDDVFIILEMYNPFIGHVKFMDLSTFEIYDVCNKGTDAMDFVDIFETGVRVCKPYMQMPKKEICSIEDIRKNDAFTIFGVDVTLSENDNLNLYGVYVCFDDGFNENGATEESYIISKCRRIIKCIDITDMSVHEINAVDNCSKITKLADMPDQKILFKF